MKSTRLPVFFLRASLAVLFAFLILMQAVSLPGQFSHDARSAPETAQLSWSLLVGAELVVLCLQVVIVCIWRLLTMVRRDRIFTEASLPWVDGIAWACSTGWIVLAAVAAYVTGFIYFTPQIRDPGLPILLFGVVVIGAVVVLLVLVMRALLRQAAELRTELDVVI